MKIFSIRHGEQKYPYNEQGKKMVSGLDAPLVDLGKQQMRKLRQELDRQDIILDSIYRSPLLRAQQSADELAGEDPIAIYEVDGLKEGFPNSGEGHTYEELEAIGGDIYAHPFNPDQETLDHLVQRSRKAIEFILRDAKKHGYNTIAIVGHGDPLCALDWSIKHTGIPTSYPEMRDSYYPQKGQAKEYIFTDNLTLEGEGRIITTEAAKATVEAFRHPSGKEVEVEAVYPIICYN